MKKRVFGRNFYLFFFVAFVAAMVVTYGFETPHTTAQTVIPVTACGILNQTGAAYALQNDISASGTCVSIQADNITLNLNGHTITYGTASGGSQVFGIVGCNAVKDVNCPAGTTGTFNNPTIYGPGTIIMDPSVTAGDSSNIRFGGGSNIPGSIHDLTVVTNGVNTIPLKIRYMNSGTVGWNVYNITLNDNTGGSINRTLFHGVAVKFENTFSTPGAIVHDLAITGAPQGGIYMTNYSSVIYNNDISFIGQWSNDFGLEIAGDSIEARNNYIHPVSGRGIMADGSCFSGTCTIAGGGIRGQHQLIHDNTVNVVEGGMNCGDNGIPPCTGCGSFSFGTYGIQFDDNSANNTIYNNKVTARAAVNPNGTKCAATGLRLSTYNVGNVSHDNIFMQVNDPGADGYDNSGNALKGGAVAINGSANGTFTSNRDAFVGDNATVYFEDQQVTGFTCTQCTLGKGSNPRVGKTPYATFHFYNWRPANTVNNVHFIDTTFTGGATKDSTDMGPITASFNYAEYFIDWTYTLGVKNASGNPIVGAPVTVTDALGGQVFSGTTDANGKISTVLNEFKRFNTAAGVTKEMHTPDTVVVTAAGFPSYTYNVTLSGTQADTLQLSASGGQVTTQTGSPPPPPPPPPPAPAPDTTPPTVSLTAPASGATVSGTVTVSASAADNVGVASVQFQLDGANLGSLDTAAPYTVSWNTTAATNASHVLTAIAKDAAGNSATSASVTVTVTNGSSAPPPDTTPPSVPAGLTATAASTTQINLSWTASTDNVGVAGYKIYRGGVQIATSTGVSYSDTGLTASTTYSYAIAAYDAAGNVSAQSASVSATTQSAPAPAPAPDTTPPTVSLTAPASGATVSGTVTVSASAADNVGVTKVELYVDGALKGTDTASPYNFSLDTTTFTNATHTLSAKAYDAAGNTATAANITVTVSNVAQTLTAALSASAASGTAPLTVSLTATAGGTAQGTLNYIFYCNRTDTGTNITAPTDLTVNGVTAASYTTANTCSYQSAGSYTAKVIIQRGTAAPAQAQKVIAVAAPATSGGGGGGGGGGSSTSTSSTTTAFQFMTVAVSQIADTSALVTVTTNQPASIRLNYGPTTAYGQATNPSPYLTTVFQNLLGLQPNTVYDFNIVAIAQGTTTPVISQNFVFTTQPAPVPISTGGGGGYVPPPTTSGGGGGGGGGGSSAYVPPPTSTSGSGSSSGVPANPPQGISQPPVFPRNISLGDEGSDVRVLQQLLQTLNYFPADFTPTAYFGLLTQHALLLFQRDHQLNRSGFLDLQSETLLNKVAEAQGIVADSNAGIGSPSAAPSTSTSTSTSTSFARYLTVGSKGADVTALQQTLIKDNDYPEGIVTGYFGLLTQKAVQRFQAKYGIVSAGTPGTTGYGAVGPRTRAKLGTFY